MHTVVDLTLDRTDRRFSFPGSGTRSLLFRFDDITFGGVVTAAGGEELRPGSEHVAATLELWRAECVQIGVGAKFVVWYGGEIGQGVVTSILTQP